MATRAPRQTVKSARPSVYLDQWVWIRLARAEAGKPAADKDLALLASLEMAAAKGIAFPLSVTHYEETGRIRDPAQRAAIARVMARIARGRTLRSRSGLVRHQLLTALHETLGRPAFRPPEPQILGLGVHWAFRGIEGFMTVVDAEGNPLESVAPDWHRRLNQYYEYAPNRGPR